MLSMEACKISDGGQLNSGTVEASLDYGDIENPEEGVCALGGPGNFEI
jgi:hypothetical protein